MQPSPLDRFGNGRMPDSVLLASAHEDGSALCRVTWGADKDRVGQFQKVFGPEVIDGKSARQVARHASIAVLPRVLAR